MQIILQPHNLLIIQLKTELIKDSKHWDAVFQTADFRITCVKVSIKSYSGWKVSECGFSSPYNHFVYVNKRVAILDYIWFVFTSFYGNTDGEKQLLSK